jgi:hypothetical protein
MFTMAVPLAVFCFEFFSENPHEWRGIASLGIYLLIFGGTAVIYRFFVAPGRWQNRFQDYRAVAEAMRVQLYWAGAGFPAAVSDHYLRKQSGELGWIQFALRGPALWAAALAANLKEPKTDAIKAGWIADQAAFFSERWPLYEEIARRNRAVTEFLAALAFVVSAVLLFVDWKLIPLGPDQTLPKIVQIPHDMAVMAAATLPALAAFFTLSSELRGYEPLTESYRIMHKLYQRAAQEVERSGEDHEAFQSLVRELGREALAENAAWLVDHRHRKIEQRS